MEWPTHPPLVGGGGVSLLDKGFIQPSVSPAPFHLSKRKMVLFICALII